MTGCSWLRIASRAQSEGREFRIILSRRELKSFALSMIWKYSFCGIYAEILLPKW